jgi:hypothetical protein
MLKAHRDSPEVLADILTSAKIEYLVSLLSEKDDTVRYPAFLVLSSRSRNHPDVYPFWNVFAEKLGDANSFQRTIGATLIGLNVRWDEKKLFNIDFQRLMRLCTDEKPITARQVIQTIPEWVSYAPELLEETVQMLTEINLSSVRETMRRLLLTDILNALIAIRNVQPSDMITQYIMAALTGGLLDKKTSKHIEAKFKI